MLTKIQEALPRAVNTEATASIHYDIILSPTYRVPMLYIHISDPRHRFPPTLDTLYQYLIPPQYASQTQDVGVLGGITVTVRHSFRSLYIRVSGRCRANSQQDHRIESRPVFFIHPCRTVEVMEASAGGSDVGTDEYLVLWIGAMGKCVGLDVPLALALPFQIKKSERRGKKETKYE